MSAGSTDAFSQAGDSVRRLQAEADRVVNRVRARLNGWARSPRREIGSLVGEVRRLRQGVRGQIEEAVRGVGARVERRLAGVVRPAASYLDLVSRTELDELRDRVSALEKRLNDLDKSAEAA